MNFNSISAFFAAAIMVSCLYLDRPIALLIKKHALHNRALTNEIPDLLLLAVIIGTVLLWLCFLYRYHRGINDAQTGFFRLAALTVPAAYVLKSVLKYSFGRVNTRYWLIHPTEPDFIWFGGGEIHNGFPSGHMAVFTAFMFSFWLFHPRFRHACLGLMILLGIALIVTSYHFLGDVLAGAWLGIIVNVFIAWSLDIRGVGDKLA